MIPHGAVVQIYINPTDKGKNTSSRGHTHFATVKSQKEFVSGLTINLITKYLS